MDTSGKNVAENSQKIADRNFQNWLKAYLVISFVKDGIKDSVSKKLQQWHEKILTEVASSKGSVKDTICTRCQTENVLYCKTKRICILDESRQCQFHNSEQKTFRPCPKGICNVIKDKIKTYHTSKIPSWINTRAERWCQNPWETAKCFMPPNAYLDTNSIDETDLNGILNVLINHKIFREMFDGNDCEVVRQLVNKVRHSPELLFTNEELNNTIETLSSFLSNCVYLKNDERAKEAVQKIEKLRSEELTISTNDVSTILQEVKNAHTCQNVTRLLQQAIETLQENRTQEHKTLEHIFTLLEKISDALFNIQHMPPPSLEQTSQILSETTYQDIKQKMKSDLLTFNRKHHSTIPLSPLFDEKDTALTDFYVFPKILVVDSQTSVFGGRSFEKRTTVTSLPDVFFKKHKRCNEIYVTSEAGLGKTVFCKRLAVTWCHSHQSVEKIYFSEQDLEAMREFEFLFLILLRDANECEIEEMIRNQIVSHLGHSHLYNVDFVEEVLSRESCLILLDGLDEWTHPQEKPSCKAECPGIPHRKSWETSTVLTTTRSWKFSELNIKSSQNDQVIQIQGLDSESAKTLTANTITKLVTDESEIAQVANKFSTEIRDKSIQLFTAVPQVLTYLICLLYCGKSFGHSKCDIYSNIIGLQLYQVEQKNEKSRSLGHSSNKRRKIDLPKSIADNEYCKKHYEFLLKLGMLAFKTFFAPNREDSFAFEKGIAETILTTEHLDFSLKAGFLTQNRISGAAFHPISKMSFTDQTFQEYFAALYMQSVHTFSGIIREVTAVCNSVESILTMSNVCVFLSGLCPGKASSLSKKLCELAATSDIATGYRNDMGSWNYFIGYNKAMKEYQNMHIACVEEFTENFQDSKHSIHIYLEDYFIDADYTSKKYSTFLETLVEMNKTRIKSVKIRDIKTKESFNAVVNLFKRNNVKGLEKIDMKCEFENEDLESLLLGSENSLKCFIVKGGRWKDDHWQDSYISLSDISFAMMRKSGELEDLYLRNVEMTHIQIERLVNFIAQHQQMKHIGVSFIKCNSHGDKCPGVIFNLRGHRQLKILELGDAPFSSVDINNESLEVCYVGPLSIAHAQSSFLTCLSKAPKLQVFSSGFLRGTAVDTLMKCIPQLVRSRKIWLFGMDFGERSFEIDSNMIVCEIFLMVKVKATCKTFQNLIESLSKAKQSVEFGLFECNISPESDFEAAKECIRKSGNFIVRLDGKDDNNCSEFLFQTVAKV